MSQKVKKIIKLEEKIDNIVKEGSWSFDDVFLEHNYSNIDSSMFDCVVYFLAG